MRIKFGNIKNEYKDNYYIAFNERSVANKTFDVIEYNYPIAYIKEEFLGGNHLKRIRVDYFNVVEVHYD